MAVSIISIIFALLFDLSLMNCTGFFLQHSWNIGFVEESLDSVLFYNSNLSIQWLKHDFDDRWFADPFILDVDEENVYVLVEDFLRSMDKAHISLLTVDRKDYHLKKLEVVLEESTHLSFPAITRKQDSIYIYPENGASGALKLYEFDRDTRKFRFRKMIIDRNLADAVLFTLNDKPYLITTEGEEMNGKTLNFYLETEHGYELEHQVHFDRNIARNAGEWFTYEGKIFRPAQDCGLRYGAAMEIQVFNSEDFSFKTIRRFEPSSPKYNLGIHTFNHYKGLSVVDGYGYDRPLLAHLYLVVSRIKQQIC